MQMQVDKNQTTPLDYLQKELDGSNNGTLNTGFTFTFTDSVFMSLNNNSSMADTIIIQLLRSFMLTILMAEVFPEIVQSNILISHVLERRREQGKDWT